MDNYLVVSNPLLNLAEFVEQKNTLALRFGSGFHNPNIWFTSRTDPFELLAEACELNGQVECEGCEVKS